MARRKPCPRRYTVKNLKILAVEDFEVFTVLSQGCAPGTWAVSISRLKSAGLPLDSFAGQEKPCGYYQSRAGQYVRQASYAAGVRQARPGRVVIVCVGEYDAAAVRARRERAFQRDKLRVADYQVLG